MTIPFSGRSAEFLSARRFPGRLFAAVIASFLVLVGVVASPTPSSAVAPALVLPEAQTFATADTFSGVVPAGNGDVLTGFTGNVRAVLSVDNGLLRIGGSSTYTDSGTSDTLSVGGSTVNVAIGYQYAAIASSGAGRAELAFEGAIADINAVLAELEFSRGAGTSTLTVSAVKAGSGGAVAYDPVTQRYYEFVNTSVNWRSARCAAKFVNGDYSDASPRYDKCDVNFLVARTFNGLPGYLATVTSSAENAFVTSKAGTAAAWIGGSDMATTRLAGDDTNITAAEQTWRWSDGPEAGLAFWKTGCNNSGTETTSCSVSGVSASTQYSYWNANEPNGGGGTEEALQLLSGGTGKWNDLPEDSSTLPYIVEYGGFAEDAPEEQVNQTVALSVAQNGPPTGLSVSAGDASAAISWTAPVIVTGTTVSSYVVTSTPEGLSCTTASTACSVSGLTNGVSYTFVVAVNFADSSSRNSSASTAVTPVAAPPAPSGGGGGTPAPTSTPASTPVVVPQRVIVPPQPTPTPRVLTGPVVSPGGGFDPNAGTRATIGGVPATVTKRPLDGGGVSVQAGAFQLGINLGTPQPSNTPGAAQSDVTVPTGQSTRVNGGGLLPGSQLQVWLPGMSGTTPNELARIPVKADGTFESELSFTARQSETPIPIGRQVMQVTGYDGDGNQTVVDMTINVAQGAVTPEANRTIGALPALSAGASLATSAGTPTPVTLTPFPELASLAVGDGDWTMIIEVDPDSGSVEGNVESALLTMTQGSQATSAGEGFLPGTTASVWLFSDPTLMTTITVGEDGTFSADFVIDSMFIPAGEHTLQIQGVGDDGFIRAANLGVLVQEPLTLTSESATGLLWWVLIAVVAVLVAVMLIVIVRRRLSRSAI
ncbi:hypothetical protein N9M74_01780 [Pontimonas sp.]|nr:hypothetical protein [Pontimonas sp.]